MFIRAKKHKNNSYAYLVENKWYKTHQQSRQKTKKYLGKICTPEKKHNNTLEQHIKTKNINKYIKKTPIKTILLNLIKLELRNHSFKQIKNNTYQHKNIIINLKNKKVYDKNTNKPACIELNNNFLTKLTLTKLINFEPPKQSTKMQIGKSFASTILASGIKINQDLFILVFNKIYKNLK